MALIARHPRPKQLEGVSIEEIACRYVARFGERKPDENFIPAGNFTLSIMAVPPGQGNAAHTHEVEEVFFVLKGHLTVFVEDETGRLETVLGPWDCISCPAGVIHGYQNNTVDMVYLNFMVGKGKPDLMGYTDPELFKRRAEHIEAAAQKKAD